MGGIQPDCWCSCLCHLHFAPENTQDGEQRYDFGYHPVGTSTYLGKQEVEKPSQNAAQPCVRVQGYVTDDLKAGGLWKGWGFWVGTWNVDSLTSRAGEVVEALTDRKVDVVCIQET